MNGAPVFATYTVGDNAIFFLCECSASSECLLRSLFSIMSTFLYGIMGFGGFVQGIGNMECVCLPLGWRLHCLFHDSMITVVFLMTFLTSCKVLLVSSLDHPDTLLAASFAALSASSLGTTAACPGIHATSTCMFISMSVAVWDLMELFRVNRLMGWGHCIVYKAETHTHNVRLRCMLVKVLKVGQILVS